MTNTNENTTIENDERQLNQLWPIENTPFTVVKLDTQHFLTMGKYRISDPYPNHEQLLKAEQPQQINWNRLMQVIQIMIEINTSEIQNNLTTKTN